MKKPEVIDRTGDFVKSGYWHLASTKKILDKIYDLGYTVIIPKIEGPIYYPSPNDIGNIAYQKHSSSGKAFRQESN
ncbi:MAG: hypothetical protein L3J71_11145 [Victivallaceae bacterium]|nr:hypothetical protein [Victivallaceae bacterium]